MTKYEELKEGVTLTDIERRKQVSSQMQKRDSDYYKYATPALNRSEGASAALRKYELAKRDYEKASLLGKAFLKLTGQANFKKMLEEAKNRNR